MRPDRLEERAVAGRRVGHHDRRGVVVAGDHDAELALQRRIDRPAHASQPRATSQFDGGREQGAAAAAGIVLAFEEAEEAGPVAVVLVVQPVDDRGDAADDAAVPPRRGTPRVRRAARRDGAAASMVSASPRSAAGGRRPGRRGRWRGEARGTPPVAAVARPAGPRRPVRHPLSTRVQRELGRLAILERRAAMDLGHGVDRRAGRPRASASPTA